MNAYQILVGARGIIPESKSWCQNFDALNKKGTEVDWDSPSTCRLCLITSISKAYSKARGRKELR